MPETRNQLIRCAEKLPEDVSEVVHRFADGFTIRKIRTRGALHREGSLMRNCWQLSGLRLVPEHRRERWLQGLVGADPYHSLRDADNLPVLSFFLHRDEDAEWVLRDYFLKPPKGAWVFDQVERARSKPPTEEQFDYLRRFAASRKRPVFVQWYDKEDDLCEIDALNEAAEAAWAAEGRREFDELATSVLVAA